MVSFACTQPAVCSFLSCCLFTILEGAGNDRAECSILLSSDAFPSSSV